VKVLCHGNGDLFIDYQDDGTARIYLQRDEVDPPPFVGFDNLCWSDTDVELTMTVKSVLLDETD
jgi:hypothetical protein